MNAKKECALKRGGSGSISIDFTPDFESKSPEFVMSLMVPVETAWPGMDKNACNFMTCPVVKGVQNFYNFSVELNEKFPVVSLEIF